MRRSGGVQSIPAIVAGMRTRSLVILVLVMVVIVVVAWVALDGGDNAFTSWLKSMHGPPPSGGQE